LYILAIGFSKTPYHVIPDCLAFTPGDISSIYQTYPALGFHQIVFPFSIVGSWLYCDLLTILIIDDSEIFLVSRCDNISDVADNSQLNALS
jgi:hypothetical protein